MFTLFRRPGARLSFLWLTLLFNQCLAGVSNRTIDDVFGDSETRHLPVFLPENLGVWKDQTCGDCSINPDKSLARDNTYHSATYNPDLKSVNVTMNFDGIAIYVFLILANNAGPGITTETNCIFKLDGKAVGAFNHVPSTSTDILYDVLAFSKTDIPPGNHHFAIVTEGLTTNSYLNFDYAIYTHEDTTTSTGSSGSTISQPTPTTISTSSPPSNSSKAPVGVIVGSVIGGVVCLAAIGVCLYFARHQRRRNIKRINLLGDSDSDTPHTTASRPRPFSPLLSQSHPMGRYSETGAPSSPSVLLTQTYETPRPPNLPPGHSPSALPSTNTSFIVSNPDHPKSPTTRQAELQRRVTLMKGKIKNLEADLTTQTGSTTASERVEGTALSRSSDGTPSTVNVRALQDQIRMLTEEVSLLQAQQSSPWIRNLNLEPPPDYTTDYRDDERTSRPTNI